MINVGAAYEWGDWTFAGDVDFWQWAKFKQIAFDFEGREDLREVVSLDYADSAQIRLGAERRLGTTWAVRGGVLPRRQPGAGGHAFAAALRRGPERVHAGGIVGAGAVAHRRRGCARAVGCALHGRDRARRTTRGPTRAARSASALSVGYAFLIRP